MSDVQEEVVEFLQHFGVRGMRWGVRTRKNKVSKHKKGRQGLTTFDKHPHRLSDTELSKRIKRLEFEKKYMELNAPKKSKGKEYTQSLLENSGRTVVGAIIGGAAGYFVQRELKKRFA